MIDFALRPGHIWRYLESCLVCSRVGKALNCEREVKNPQNLYAVGLGNMALQWAMYYVSSHESARYFLIRHGGGVIGPL